jgi:hypothetical protein
MARVDYDPFEGITRLHEVVDRLGRRAGVILTLHIALEREVVQILDRLLPFPDRLRNLGFTQKVQVLNAAWQGEERSGDLVSIALHRFNDLRNAVGHGNDDRVEGCLRALTAAYRELQPDSSENPSIEDIAGGILAFFGDGPTPEEIGYISNGLAAVVGSFPNAAEPHKGYEAD